MSTDQTSTPSIRVDRRDGRSFANAATQQLLKPLARLLLKPGEPQPPGSPRLTPPTKAHHHYTIRETQVADTWLYTFAPEPAAEPEPERGGSRADILYYFAGGGFRGAPEKEHWLFCLELAQALPQYEIRLVSYPLAPNSPASRSLPQLERLYDVVSARATEQNARITLCGDSAGGNIALVLGLYAASQHLKDAPALVACPVRAIVAICPPVDLRNGNPDIDFVGPQDPLLSRKLIEEVAAGWRAELPATDPRVSPVLADLTVLKDAGIKVDGVTAGYDVLTPDAIKFREQLARCHVEGDWLEWEKQMHCFPLLHSFHVHEGVAGKDWIVELLRANACRRDAGDDRSPPSDALRTHGDHEIESARGS